MSPPPPPKDWQTLGFRGKFNINGYPEGKSNSPKRTYCPYVLSSKKSAFTLAEGATRVARPNSQRHTAFTLAEVLITLGIIGVVAALTIPTIVTKYRRQSAENKLKKFYSVMNQAVQMSIAEHGDITLNNQNIESSNNSDYITMWYKEYITKYIKTLKSEKVGIDYYSAVFADGSAFNSYMSATGPTGESNLYIFYCLNYNICPPGHYDGKDHFLFIYNPTKKMVTPVYSGADDINTLKDRCYNSSENSRFHCAALIEANGWKIPDDYPYIK